MKTSVLQIDSKERVTSVPFKRRWMACLTRWLCYSALAGAVGVLVCAGTHYWPEPLPAESPKLLLRIEPANAGYTVSAPGYVLVADLADFDDGFFAYLMFDHYRSRKALKGRNVFLVSDDASSRTIYRILLELAHDLIAGVEELAGLKAQGLTSSFAYRWCTEAVVREYAASTSMLVEAFRSPSDRSFARIQKEELQGYLGRFIRFKSLTDPRLHRTSDKTPSPLTRNEADRLAADMIAVADFYNVPLDLMIGIGAMENNYMSVPGDLENTKWKPRAQPGDVIVSRARDGVLVRNDSSGVWQITRESLRYAHKLYVRDHRDYNEVPERLRPPREFQMDSVRNDVLTTYAGLLLSDLLEHFQGDVFLAAGAYNGSTDRPNFHYAAGVKTVASYARNVMEGAAVLKQLGTGNNSDDQQPVTERRIELQTRPTPDEGSRIPDVIAMRTTKSNGIVPTLQ